MKIPEVKTIFLKEENESIKGFRILHISDLHITTKTNYVNELIKLCNNIDINIICITGDIIDTKVHKIKEQLKLLNTIKKPVFYVSGNHDFYHGIKPMIELLDNFYFVDNKVLTINYNNQDIQIVGLSDSASMFFGIKRNVKEVLSKVEENIPNIFLAHRPKDYKKALKINSKLFLCGHTHGGQIYPFHYLVKLANPFVAGLFKKKNTYIYVNRGLGFWGIDYRLKAPNEITILEFT